MSMEINPITAVDWYSLCQIV